MVFLCHAYHHEVFKDLYFKNFLKAAITFANFCPIAETNSRPTFQEHSKFIMNISAKISFYFEKRVDIPGTIKQIKMHDVAFHKISILK